MLTDVLTLEMTIGGENAAQKNEYLLVHPTEIAVNDKNEIFICDENRIKVYGMNGTEKRIVGNPGSGPGEFEEDLRFANIDLSNSGYLIIFIRGKYHIFSPEYKFIEKTSVSKDSKFKELIASLEIKYPFIDGDNFISFNRGELVYSFQYYKNAEKPYDILVYHSPDTIIIIANYLRTSYIPVGGLDTPILGRLYSAVLSGRRIVYAHAGNDYEIKDKKVNYMIHIYSLDTHMDTVIKHSYNQVEFPDSIYDEYNTDFWNKDTEMKKRRNAIINTLKTKKCFAPIRSIKTDGNIIFAFSYQTNVKGECLTDLFDANAGDYLRSVFFPEWLGYSGYLFDKSIIKDGYVYRITSSEKEFAKIEKYRIDPKVYGK